MSSEQITARELQQVVFTLLLPFLSDRTDAAEEWNADARRAPPFHIFELFTWNVALEFLTGVATGLVSGQVLNLISKRKNRDELIAREEVVELMSEILRELRKPNVMIILNRSDEQNENLQEQIEKMLTEDDRYYYGERDDAMKIVERLTAVLKKQDKE